jgi:two-component system, repressor protein LuxO
MKRHDMKRHEGRILIVEDVATLAGVYASYLAEEKCDVAIAGSAAATLRALDERVPDVMVLDVNLPDGNGLELLREVQSRDLPTAVIVITSQASVGLAVEAMKHGAIDFLTKPFNAERLRVTVRNALARRRLESQVATVQDELERDQFCGFVGQSMVMQSVYRILQNAAASRANVLVTGERGTGKRLCAQALHRLGRRHDRPFVAIDCAALRPDQLEVAIFGQFSRTATMDRQGGLLKANGGTIFLDEVCDLPADLQAKLRRFLQSGTVLRRGDPAAHRVDVRLICATSRDPRAEVAAGRFDEDLLYKIDVIPIALPPLRERDDDVLRLARYFMRRLASGEGKGFGDIAADAEAALLGYDWPGNVRELESVIRGIVALNTGDRIDAAMLPPALAAAAIVRPAEERASLPTPANDAEGIEPLELVMRRTVEDAIRKSGGSIPRAAAALQVTPASLYRRLQSWQSEETGESA